MIEQLGPYQVHPVAAELPLLGVDELKELADDIHLQGQQEPIVLTDDNRIADGRNRYRACEILNIEPVFRKLPDYYTEEMIRDFIVSANIKRRQMNPGQLAVTAVALKKYYDVKPGRPRKDAEKTEPDPAPLSKDERSSAGRAGAAVGASHTLVGQATALARDASDLFEKVRDGELAITAADAMRKERIKDQPTPDPEPKPNTADPILLTLVTHEGAEVKYPKPVSKAAFNETTGDGISWAGWSWNPVTGCLHGCEYCYAREIATSKRFEKSYPVGFTPLFHRERLDAPANTTIPKKHLDDPAYKRVFVCSMADLYGQWVPKEWIEQVHAAMLESPQWQYITLTKFPDRYAGLKLPEGAWIGTSVDEQKRVRIAERAFRKLPDGVVKWLSLEPLREPLEFADLTMFDWVVIGAQTETRQPDGVVPAFNPPFEWVQRIYAQAREAGCRIHFKPNLRNMVFPDEYPTSTP